MRGSHRVGPRRVRCPRPAPSRARDRPAYRGAHARASPARGAGSGRSHPLDRRGAGLSSPPRPRAGRRGHDAAAPSGRAHAARPLRRRSTRSAPGARDRGPSAARAAGHAPCEIALRPPAHRTDRAAGARAVLHRRTRHGRRTPATRCARAPPAATRRSGRRMAGTLRLRALPRVPPRTEPGASARPVPQSPRRPPPPEDGRRRPSPRPRPRGRSDGGVARASHPHARPDRREALRTDAGHLR